MTLFLAPEMCQIAQLMPGPTPDRNRTILTHAFPTQPPDAAALQGLHEKCTVFARVVDTEDYQLGLKVQQGLESGALQHVTFGRNEPANQHFHRSVKRHLAEAGPLLVEMMAHKRAATEWSMQDELDLLARLGRADLIEALSEAELGGYATWRAHYLAQARKK